MTETTFDSQLQGAKLTKWNKEPTVMELKQDFQDAKPVHDTQTSKIAEWLDNLHVRGKAKIKSTGNNSSIVPKLIRKQAEWRYPALSEPFLSTDDVFNVNPISWEDKNAAIQNQIVLNNQFNTKIEKVSFIDEYVRTLVDEGTAILKTGWRYEEEEYDAEEPVFEYVINPELGPLHQQLAQMKAEDPQRYASEVEPELQQAHDLTLEYGEPIEARMTGSKRVKKIRVLRNHPTVEICDYRNVLIDPSCDGDMSKAQFVIHSFESSLALLKQDGRYKNLDRINIDANSILGAPDHALSDGQTKTFNFADKPRKKFVVYEYWGFRDIDGSGRLRPIVAAWVGDTMIRMEENPFPDQQLPFINVAYLPIRKSTYGEPDGALLEDNQRIAGAVTRGMIDLMAKSANSQTGVRKDALDITNRRKFEQGKDYEFNGNVDPRQAIFMHTYAEIPVSAQFMLQLQNQEAESLTGVKAFSQGIGSQALGDVAAGIRGALDAASKRELGILRRLSAGVIAVGRKFIAMNAAFLSEEEVIRITNEEFVTVRRDDLPGNFDLKLSISTAEEDNAKAEQLAFMLQTLGNNMDPMLMKIIISDIARLRKMPDLAKRIMEFEPAPDPVAQKLQELEIAKLEAEITELRAQAMERQAAAELKLAQAKKASAEADKVDLDFVEQESGVTQERDLQKHKAQAESQKELKQLDHEFKRKEKKSK